MVAAGHRPADIWGYTLRQIDSFTYLHLSRERDNHAAMAATVRMAYHGDGKQFTKFMKELQDDE